MKPSEELIIPCERLSACLDAVYDKLGPIPKTLDSKGLSGWLMRDAQDESLDPLSHFILGLYDHSFKEIVQNYSIDEDMHFKLKELLETAATMYLVERQMECKPHRPESPNGNTVYDLNKKIKKISTLAAKLKVELNTADVPIQDILRIINHEGLLEDADVFNAEFIKQFSKELDSFINLKVSLKDSTVGRHIGLGKQAPKGRPHLRRWVALIYMFWTETLHRNMTAGPGKMDGRKHLNNFLLRCMDEIDSTVEIETMDHFLKSVQTQHKKDPEFLRALFTNK